MKRSFRSVLVVSVLLAATLGSSAAQSVDDGLGEEALQVLQDYLRVDTINPPGNEMRAVDFFAKLLEREGISYESAQSAPGRGNIWARLRGGDEPALVLLHHSDVVPADVEHWTVDPLSGAIEGGFLYGRGALDTKTLGIQHFMAFVALHRAGIPLRRDVIFMATADEEAGGFAGAGWMVENRPEVFTDVGFLLNEGGRGSVQDGRVWFNVEVTQKVPLWLELTAEGAAGHGSTPPLESAVNRLVRALGRLQTYDFEPRVVPEVDAFFKAIARQADDDWRPQFENIAEAVSDPDTLLRLQIDNRFLAAIVRNTCSITMLEGSSKINVVPPSASAQLDCRLLPDQDLDAFVEELSGVLNDSAISIRRIMGFTPASSSTDTELYRAIEALVTRHFPGAPVIPTVGAGFTDSHFFRDLGITSYGFGAVVLPAQEFGGVHGNDERVPVEQVERGTVLIAELVLSFVQ